MEVYHVIELTFPESVPLREFVKLLRKHASQFKNPRVTATSLSLKLTIDETPSEKQQPDDGEAERGK